MTNDGINWSLTTMNNEMKMNKKQQQIQMIECI